MRDALAIQRRTLGSIDQDEAASVYQLAILDEQEGKIDEAIDLLRDSINHGLAADVKDGIGTSPDFNRLHSDLRFNTIVKEIKDRNGKPGQKTN